jgi:hypothetical protein
VDENVMPPDAVERFGVDMDMVEGCWRMENTNVLFAERREHCG